LPIAQLVYQFKLLYIYNTDTQIIPNFSKLASAFVRMNEKVNEILFMKQITTNTYYTQVCNKPVHPC